MCYFTGKLELVSNISWVIVSLILSFNTFKHRYILCLLFLSLKYLLNLIWRNYFTAKKLTKKHKKRIPLWWTTFVGNKCRQFFCLWSLQLCNIFSDFFLSTLLYFLIFKLLIDNKLTTLEYNFLNSVHTVL